LWAETLQGHGGEAAHRQHCIGGRYNRPFVTLAMRKLNPSARMRVANWALRAAARGAVSKPK